MDFSFGDGQMQTDNNNGAGDVNNTKNNVTNITNQTVAPDDDTTNLDDINNGDNSNNNDDKGNNNNDDKGNDKGNNDGNDKSTDNDDSELSQGDVVEIGNNSYTVDDKGNLVDASGNIFKEAKDVKSFLEGLDKVDDDTEELNIQSIQNAIGITVTDENDKPVEFENTVEGIKSYMNAVIEAAKEEHYETAINTLYQRYPILNDVLNYYIANGNSLEGFGEVPDRSGITIDDANEAQQEYIIRTAWSEQGRKGNVDNYIAYLKSNGTLAAIAKEELEGLQESDRAYKEEMEKQAKEIEDKRIADTEKYWNGVHDVIKNRNIAGYQIPENIIISRNGEKISASPEDFFNYIYRVDENGQSAYVKDLLQEIPESRRDDEILRAYLKFVGGNYSNLVDMAINKATVNKLRFKAKEKSTSYRVTKPTNNNQKKDINFSY